MENNNGGQLDGNKVSGTSPTRQEMFDIYKRSEQLGRQVLTALSRRSRCISAQEQRLRLQMEHEIKFLSEEFVTRSLIDWSRTLSHDKVNEEIDRCIAEMKESLSTTHAEITAGATNERQGFVADEMTKHIANRELWVTIQNEIGNLGKLPAFIKKDLDDLVRQNKTPLDAKTELENKYRGRTPLVPVHYAVYRQYYLDHQESLLETSEGSRAKNINDSIFAVLQDAIAKVKKDIDEGKNVESRLRILVKLFDQHRKWSTQQ